MLEDLKKGIVFQARERGQPLLVGAAVAAAVVVVPIGGIIVALFP